MTTNVIPSGSNKNKICVVFDEEEAFQIHANIVFGSNHEETVSEFRNDLEKALEFLKLNSEERVEETERIKNSISL